MIDCDAIMRASELMSSKKITTEDTEVSAPAAARSAVSSSFVIRRVRCASFTRFRVDSSEIGERGR